MAAGQRSLNTGGEADTTQGRGRGGRRRSRGLPRVQESCRPRPRRVLELSSGVAQVPCQAVFEGRGGCDGRGADGSPWTPAQPGKGRLGELCQFLWVRLREWGGRTSPAFSPARTPARLFLTLPTLTVELKPTEHRIPWPWPQERSLRTEGPKPRPQRMVPGHQPIRAPLLNNTG